MHIEIRFAFIDKRLRFVVAGYQLRIEILSANKAHRSCRLYKFRVVDMMTPFFFFHDALDELDDLFSAWAASDEITQIMLDP